jgi:hypothetical protein
MLIFAFIYVYIGNIGKVLLGTEQSTITKPVGEILKGSEIGELFHSQYNDICGVSIKLATYNRVNTGYVIIGIKEVGKENYIYSNRVNVASIKDNDYYHLRFPPIKQSKDKKYYIYIKSESGKPGNAITAYMNEKDDYKSGNMIIDGKNQAGDLVFQVYYNKTFVSLIKGI